MFTGGNLDNIKWQKYLRIGEEDFSASCEVDEGARNLHKNLIDMLPPRDKILDIGCGTGWSTNEFTKKYNYAVGISIQTSEIDFAMKNYYSNDKLCFELMDMHELKFSDSHFDTVYMREVLEHSIAPFIALCEANRVLKISGMLLVNVPDQTWQDWHCHYIVPTDLQLRSLLAKTNFIVEKFGTTEAGHNWYLTVKTGDIDWIK